MDEHPYQPGLHIATTLSCPDQSKLRDLKAFMSMINQLILDLNLNSLGSVEHSFEGGGGFTAVVCLTESHLSIHTWPEFRLLTFDVFLSNFMRNNDAACRAIEEAVRNYFESEVIHHNELRR